MTKHVCVINWKGGCGKTTIANHLAVALASSGLETGLADYDRQETAKLWGKLRPKDAVAVSLINWRKDFGRRPEEFLASEGLLLTARIPEREIYSDLARDGLTVFDRHNKASLEQQQAWLPLVREVEKPWPTASHGFQVQSR